jgi:hypothetical protein
MNRAAAAKQIENVGVLLGTGIQSEARHSGTLPKGEKDNDQQGHHRPSRGR